MQKTADTLTREIKLACSHREAAKAISVSERTLSRLVADGIIRRTKLNGRNVFPLAELERVLSENLV